MLLFVVLLVDHYFTWMPVMTSVPLEMVPASAAQTLL